MSIAKINQEILDLLNQVRKNPRILVPMLEEMKTKFEGMLLKQPGKTSLRTKEGVAAVEDAIKFL